nr:hypothetical protein [Candidatus Sigynarchaeota archaeon]
MDCIYEFSKAMVKGDHDVAEKLMHNYKALVEKPATKPEGYGMLKDNFGSCYAGFNMITMVSALRDQGIDLGNLTRVVTDWEARLKENKEKPR